MMFHIGLEMDAASGSATRQMAATLRSLLLTQITMESPKPRGMKGGKDKGNYSIFFENCTWFLCLSRLLWDGPINILLDLQSPILYFLALFSSWPLDLVCPSQPCLFPYSIFGLEHA